MRYIIILLIFLCPGLLFCQSTQYKYDQHWIIGYNKALSGNRGINLTFANGQIAEDSFAITEDIFENCSSISDKEGNLLFYTNGCRIINRNFVMMENGDSLNRPSLTTSQNCDNASYNGNTGYRSMFIIPHPDSANIFNILHFRFQSAARDKTPDILLTKVDMSYNGGLGKVILKNKVIYSDPSYEEPMAGWSTPVLTKHGNGRDWWLIVSKLDSRTAYALKFDHYKFSDTIVNKLNDKYNQGVVASSCISPDGKYYIRAGLKDYVEMIGFDRCLGTFVSHQYIELQYDPKRSTCGVSVSPNSRYLYVAGRGSIYQYDLNVPGYLKNRTTIGAIDTVNYDFLPEGFFLSQLAADGKIYICATNGVKRLHVINNPDEKGAACNFVNRGINLHGWIFNSIPYFPNYNLDPVTGACVIGTNNPNIFKIEIYPNPASEYITLGQLAGQKIKYEIRNINGSLCLSGDYSGSSIFVGDLPAGIYTIMAFFDGKQFLGKLAKVD